MRYVMVGSGVASIAAAEAIRSLDPTGDLLVVGDEIAGYYSRPGLAYYLNGELPEKYLYPVDDGFFRRLNIHRLQAKAVLVNTQQHQLVLADGRMLPYDRLMIATGAEAARPNVPGLELDGVFKLDNLEDARSIIAYVRRARHAIVVGGGITALEIVEGLSARGMKVTYFLRGDRYWSNVLDESESIIVERRLKQQGVNILYHTELGEIIGNKNRVVGVHTTDGRAIRCDMLAVAIGIRPRLELARASGLQVDRGIVVNEYMQTNSPDVYAAGDVAQVYDPLSGKYVLDSLWGPAREQGTAAGLNMAGKQTAYIKWVPFNVTRLADLTTTIIGTLGRGVDADLVGIARGDSETWRQLPDAIVAQSHFDVNSLRLMLGERTILGALLMGDQTLSRPLLHLVRNCVDISTIRDQLLMPDAHLADILAEFYTLQVRGNANTTQQP